MTRNHFITLMNEVFLVLVVVTVTAIACTGGTA